MSPKKSKTFILLADMSARGGGKIIDHTATVVPPTVGRFCLHKGLPTFLGFSFLLFWFKI